MKFNVMVLVIVALIIAAAISLAAAQPVPNMPRPDPKIEAQAPPRRGGVITPEEACAHHDHADGSWWRCMRDEYVRRREPCDVACQLSIGDPR